VAAVSRARPSHRHEPTAVLVHLSGDLRGTSQRVAASRIVIGTSVAADVRLFAHERTVGAEHAVLERRDGSFELQAAPGRAVWVNGERVERRPLVHGDLLEIGPEGPVLRFRLYEPGSTARKSPREAFADSLDSARRSRRGRLGRTGLFLAGLTRELATQTTLAFRALVAVVLLLLLGGIVFLAVRGVRLERELEAETARLRAVSALVATDRATALKADDLTRLRAELESQIGAADARLRTLEARTEAPARVVAAASGAVVFVQGSFGFLDAQTHKPYRLAAGSGTPQAPGDGGEGVAVTTEGDGPLLERFYTGTAWVVSGDGLLVTNRHVTRPWEEDPDSRAVLAQGIEAERLRMVGYLPASAQPLGLEVVSVSPRADLALLRARGAALPVPALALRDEPVRPGEEVLVLGYPAGIPALLARGDPKLARALLAEKPALDFWSLVRRLAAQGQIAPLATRGIVGQVTASAVVFDAQTTFGGSGGPVLDLDGRVVAVSSAVLAGFGGSNMGVPAAEVARLLERAPAAAPAK
jgi:serine protease Do